MIKQLSIKNLAIIDDISIDLDDNFNVLTGETGAGKSIIIDAIELIFGKRADVELIAQGKEFASITALIYLNEKTQKIIQSMIDIDISEEFIINRTINRNGRSTCKINGEIVPLFTLNNISNIIVDISSQYESQFLLNEKNHLSLLDSFIESYESNFKDNYQIEYKKYKEILNTNENIKESMKENNDIDYLNFKYNELKDYNYTLEDEENIVLEYKNYQNAYKNKTLIEDVINSLDGEDGAGNRIYHAIKSLNKANFDDKLVDRLNSIYIDFDDFVASFKSNYDNDNLDENRIDYLSNEISKINSLKRKYNVNNLLEYKNKLKEKIELYNNFDNKLLELNKKLNCQKEIIEKEALKLSNIRHKYAEILSKSVLKELDDLYLSDASFSLQFDNVEYNNNGNETVSFYMSTNKGNDEAPLTKVASGGEVSRIMLGLKSVFCKLFNVDIVIFDEIDSGVSGKVALSMGKKMKSISNGSQVLSITHLPQVAAFSDHHYYISKSFDGISTKTSVKKLNNEEKIMEVARLLSGDKITDTFINSAKELIKEKEEYNV